MNERYCEKCGAIATHIGSHWEEGRMLVCLPCTINQPFTHIQSLDKHNELDGWKNYWADAITRLSKVKEENQHLRAALERIRDCDWVITLPDRMDAVRQIAREALE